MLASSALGPLYPTPGCAVRLWGAVRLRAAGGAGCSTDSAGSPLALPSALPARHARPRPVPRGRSCPFKCPRWPRPLRRVRGARGAARAPPCGAAPGTEGAERPWGSAGPRHGGPGEGAQDPLRAGTLRAGGGEGGGAGSPPRGRCSGV